MKPMKFVTGSLLALALFTFAAIAPPMKAFATEQSLGIVQEEKEEEVQVILPDSLSEEDEKAINKLVFAYQRSRSATPDQLEAKISNYFEVQYGTTRAIYVVEFKSQVNGNVGGRLVYVLMGNDTLKQLNQASGGFIVPETKAKAGYAFDNWSYIDGVRIESNDLGTYNIQGSSIFYAEFAPDSNGDGIADHKQRKFNIQFHEDGNNGTLEGGSFSSVAFEKVQGEGCYIIEAVGFWLPKPIAFPGYAFDYWVTHKGTVIDNFQIYRTYEDLIISPVFSVDSNYDGVPDHKQTLYGVDFLAASGGTISGNSHFIVSAWDNGEGEFVGYFEVMYPSIWENDMVVAPDDGYMLEYWIDQNGDTFYPYSEKDTYLWDNCWEYQVKNDTVFVAVFTEDINGDLIPDYKQTFLNVDFMATSGGYLEGTTHYIVPVTHDTAIGDMGNMRDAFPHFNNNSFKVVSDNGYVLDYWIDHKGNQYEAEQFLTYLSRQFIEQDTVYVAVFTEDANNNGIPDYKEDKIN